MRAAIYCRLSEEDRNKQQATDDSESIQNQKSMLVQYATEQDWEIYNIYSDDDFTGADRNRPEFNKLLADAENHKFDIILCKTQSRFTRELEMVEKYIHGLFPLWNIRFISIVDNADTAVKGNKKSRQINGLVNEWYLEDMSENIKSVLTNRRENGFHIGAFALYGYKKDSENKGHLTIDEEAAKVVREVFSLFLQGYGKTTIARLLNDQGIPNPTEYKRLHGLRYQQPKDELSTLWKYFAVSNMLINEIYIGNMVQGKYGSVSYKSKINKPKPKDQWIRVEGTHEPIIDIDTWDQVQKIIAERYKPFDNGRIGIFAKKVRCINCGYIMRSHKDSNGSRSLQCGTKYIRDSACVGAYISIKVLERAVLDELFQLMKQYLDKGILEKRVQFNDRIAEKKQRLKNEIAAYEKKINECGKGIKSLYIDKVKGLISDEEFIELSDEFHKDKSRLEKLKAERKEETEKLEIEIKEADNKTLLIDKYTDIKTLNREMTETLIDCIYVGRRDADTKIIPIEIHWNF